MSTRAQAPAESRSGPPPGRERRPPSRAGRGRGSEQRNFPLTFLVPAFVVLLVFFFVPTVYNFVYAFTDWSSFTSAIGYVGTENFRRLLENGDLVDALRITVVYAVLVAFFQNFFGLVLAVLLERDTRTNRIGRVMFFVPVLMSALAVGYIFQALLKPDGALNAVLSSVTGSDVSVAWLGSTTWTILLVAMIHAWKWMGLSMLIYLAGLKTIDEQVLESSRLDGTTAWSRFRYIRFPLIAPAVTFNVATALLGSLNSFDIVQATTGGGPARSTELLNIFIYRTFGQGLFAQATTMSLVLFLTVALIAFPVVGFLRRRENVL